MMAVLRQESITVTPQLFLAFELANKQWKLGFSDSKAVRRKAVPAGDIQAVMDEIARAKERFKIPADSPVFSCYEAGRDGFWLHRFLAANGVVNVIVEPASIQVDRRARRAKTDRLDVEKLLSLLVRYGLGEQDVWRIVHVPSDGAEDERRMSRERGRLVKERTQHRNRIKGLLVTQGVRLSVGKKFLAELEAARLWDGSPIPPHLKRELTREFQRYILVLDQIRQIKDEQARLLKACHTESQQKIARLVQLKGIGVTSASILVHEFFGWRVFNNRRQVGSLAGLTGTPYDSGDSQRDQGISKAGNKRIRALSVELAWGWLRWQGDSKLAKWFRSYVGDGTKKRMKRVAIVALARKLLVDLWHYLEHGVIPDGACISGV